MQIGINIPSPTPPEGFQITEFTCQIEHTIHDTQAKTLGEALDAFAGNIKAGIGIYVEASKYNSETKEETLLVSKYDSDSKQWSDWS